MIKLFLLLILSLASSVSICQTKEPASDPCKDKLFVDLQKKNIDSLSQREYEYYILKTKECTDYTKYLQKLKTQKEIETEPGNGGTILAIIIGGIAVLSVIGVLLNNASK